MRRVIAALGAAAILACSAPDNAVPAPTPTLSPTPAPERTTSPTVASTPTAAATVAPTPITELSQVFRPIAAAWHPTGPTLLVVEGGAGVSTLTALPLGPQSASGAPTQILTFAGQSLDVRGDGGAIAVIVGTATGQRIATWDLRSARGAWLSTADQGLLDTTPVWSLDGSAIFFGSYGADQRGGVYRIGADGRGKIAIASLDRFGGLQGLTPDGRGLIWTRGQAGGSVEILDIATGVSRHLEDNARVVSWRAQQPRALLIVGGCCAGRPGGALVAWDDNAMTSRVIAERTPTADIAFGAASWDSSGTRIATARFDQTLPYDASLAVFDPVTGATDVVSGTQGTLSVLWIDEGIVFSRALQRSASAEIDFLPPGATTTTVLYRGANIGRLFFIRP